MKKLFIGLVALSALFSLTNCSDYDGYSPNPSGEIPNIVETANEVDLLDSLVAALMKADEESSTNLVQTLSGDGPFTVFAPTNDAFTALLESLPGYSSLEDFDTDAEKRLLAQILSYHVLPTAVSSSMIQEGMTAETVQGSELTFSLSGVGSAIITHLPPPKGKPATAFLYVIPFDSLKTSVSASTSEL